MLRTWLPILALAGAAGVTAWATDFVTLQGESTVYTVDCRQGQWQGNRCTGSLVPGHRYRFRALKVHREVLYWIVAFPEPSSRYVDCTIEDGRNWTCPPNRQPSKTITFGMSRGEPVTDRSDSPLPFHAVHKLRWLLLKAGLPAGKTADSSDA